MSILDRFSSIMSDDVSHLMESEDASKIEFQLVNIFNTLDDVESEIEEATANQTYMNNEVIKYRAQVMKYEEAAIKAFSGGDEEKARQMLEIKVLWQVRMNSAREKLKALNKSLDSLNEMKSKLLCDASRLKEVPI